MGNFPPAPPSPHGRWQLEQWARWVLIVAGFYALWDARGLLGQFLLMTFVLGVPGFAAARASAVRRRERLDYLEPEDRWRFGYAPLGMRGRWIWRAIWVGVAIVLASIDSPMLSLQLAMWWSLGWVAAEFVDKRSAPGATEWAQWQEDLEKWQSENQAAWEQERRWARAFPDYRGYRDAWEIREVGPLSPEGFVSAKEGAAD